MKDPASAGFFLVLAGGRQFLSAGPCPAASCIWANSRWPSLGLSWAGGCGGTGGAVNPSLEALAKHPCFAKPPYPRPRRPSTVCRWPRKINGGVDHFHAFPDAVAFRAVVWEPTLPTYLRRRDTPCVSAVPIRTRPSVGGCPTAAPAGKMKTLLFATNQQTQKTRPKPGFSRFQTNPDQVQPNSSNSFRIR